MAKLGTYRTLIAGILSPILAAALGAGVYIGLTRASVDRDADFVFRLTMTAVAMIVPFVMTAWLAISDRRRSALSTSGKIGLTLAFLSLALAWFPIQGMIARARQAENLALTGVQAPPFDTVDIYGSRHRLSDHEGKVVLVNIWATWCTPCRREMPDLDGLYRSRKDEGFMVLSGCRPKTSRRKRSSPRRSSSATRSSPPKERYRASTPRRRGILRTSSSTAAGISSRHRAWISRSRT